MGLFTSTHDKSSDFAGVVARALQGQPVHATFEPHAEDTVSLSYEEALKKHARRPFAEEMARIGELASAELQTRRDPAAASVAAPVSDPATAPVSAPVTSTKSASITLRMGAKESAMLRQRAAAAGISVSAYIRSCIFEAEELRAQVKQALAEIKLSRTAHHG